MNEHEQCLDVELSWDPSLPLSPGSWLKRCLLYFRTSRAQEGHQWSRGCGQRLLLIISVLLFVCIGVLLLLWNYQCIFVWGLCREDQPAVPRFGGLEGFDREEFN